jgi:hypothetical protein
MTFHDFARAHGLIIRDLISHRWVSTPTEDHPRKRNGRYKYLGNVGWVQNWATMESPTMWKDSAAAPVDYRKVFAESEKKREQDAKKAADKAAWILGKVEKKPHAYLAAKGFPELQANVWTVDGKSSTGTANAHWWKSGWGSIDNRRRGKEVPLRSENAGGKPHHGCKRHPDFLRGYGYRPLREASHAPCKGSLSN